MNASRAATLVYHRRMSVDACRPRPSRWSPTATGRSPITSRSRSEGRRPDGRMDAHRRTSRRQDGRGGAEVDRDAPDFTFQVFSVQRRTVHERPPRLYDLTGLQKDMSRLHGLTAARTLAALQSLGTRRSWRPIRAPIRSISRTTTLDTLREILGKGPGASMDSSAWKTFLPLHGST